MYDTIHLWLPPDLISRGDLKRLPTLLENFTHHQKIDGRYYGSGNFGNNYKVNISEQGVSLKGSLAKYFLPDNLHTLTRSDSARAIEKMADELCLPIDRAKVTRIDFAQNFLMRYEPEAYYPYLGECRYYKRLIQPKAVYWQNGNRTKLVYNKVAEAKKKGVSVPDVFSGQHVLRYEMRYTKKLTKNLNKYEILASTLSNEPFYMAMVKNWVSEYEAIQKNQKIKLKFDAMKTPKDLHKQAAAQYYQSMGLANAMKMVEDMRAMGTFEKPEYYSRAKKEIKELCSSPKKSSSSELITELDKKVSAAKRYCR